MLPNFEYRRPASLREAIDAAARGGSRILAGGTDLLGCLRDGVLGADALVPIGGLAELRGISRTADGGLRIGALATIAEVAADRDVAASYRALAEAAREVGSPQLRNQGTLGGNLCQKPRCWYYRGDFPCLRKGGETCYAFEGENEYHCIFGGSPCYAVHPSDTAPALVALGAQVRIAGPGGARAVPVERFHVAPEVDPRRETVLEAGEIVTEVALPAPAPGLTSAYRKARARRTWDFALAGVAVALEREGATVRRARVVLAGAAPVPWRAREAEAALVGRAVDAAAAARAGAAAVAGAEPLARNGAKVPLFRALVEQTLLELA